MSQVGGGAGRRRGERAAGHVEAAPAAPVPRGEVQEDGPRVIATFFLPEHAPRDVKYHVGRRTITLWSRRPGCEFQSILILPRWVDPTSYVLRHKNGVYEFVLAAASEPPRRADTNPA